MDVSEILDRTLEGKKLLKADLEHVARATANLRRDFLADVRGSMDEIPSASEGFVAFKNCVQSLGTLLVQNGIVSQSEIHVLFSEIEARER